MGGQRDVAVRDGTHVAQTASSTVGEAGEQWIVSGAHAGLERTTLAQYQQHLRHHIVGNAASPAADRAIFIGHLKLSQLNAPTIRAFEDRLRAGGRSPTMTRYVIRSLGALLSDAQERGHVRHNVVRELRSGRRQRGGARQERGKKLKVGVDIPTPLEMKPPSSTLPRDAGAPSC